MCSVLCRVDTQGDTHTTIQAHVITRTLCHGGCRWLGEVGSVRARGGGFRMLCPGRLHAPAQLARQQAPCPRSVRSQGFRS